MSRIILSLETSSTMCSTALIENNDILCCIEEPTYREHNEKLPSFITTTLDNSNKTINDIDALAVGIGPGSFTGLRIGLGFCKGILIVCSYHHMMRTIKIFVDTSLCNKDRTVGDI
jgi:tRNA threonylcarbamoyladenosine biosynthesis protein TsaB